MKIFITNLYLLLFTVTILFLEGCQQERNIAPVQLESKKADVISDEITLERAKKIYESSNFLEQQNARKKIRIEAPDWERAKKLRFEKGEKALVIPVYEMPESSTLMTIGQAGDPSKLTLMDLITPVQLVIYKDKEGKEVLERMYSKSDPDYRRRKENKTEDKDFTGMRWFEDESGNFKRGYVYENGEIVKRLFPNINRSPNTPSGRTLCETYTFTVTITYYSIACAGGYCGDPIYMYTQSYSYSYADCKQKHNEDYALPGQSGGGTSTDSWGNPLGEDPALQEGWGVPEDRIGQFLKWVANLNEAESAWVKANPLKAPVAWWNSMRANEVSRIKYMCQKSNGEYLMDMDGTNQNAFKHAYWNALNQRSFGSEEAKIIGDIHEVDVTSADPNIQMDLWNNQLGRKVAETCGCDGATLQQEVLQKIYSGLGKRRRIGIGSETNYLFSTNSATTLCNDY